MSDYRELEVWRKAHEMAKRANQIANAIRSPLYKSLRSQMIRAANSVPTNIVEGSGQESSRDFCRFLRYSINSANETEYHCFAAHDYGLVGAKDFAELGERIEEVRKMLYGLIRYLRSKE